MKHIILATSIILAMPAQAQTVVASWYEQGKRTASGERFDPDGMTAAHRTLPFGTVLCVADRRSGRMVRVKINDRGPYIRGRHLDLSRGAARALGMMGRGTMAVDIQPC